MRVFFHDIVHALQYIFKLVLSLPPRRSMQHYRIEQLTLYFVINSLHFSMNI